MTSLKILWFGLAAGLIVGGTLGCSRQQKQSSVENGSASSSKEDSDKVAMQKEIDHLKAERLVDEGQRAFKDGRYDDARKAFDDALKLDRDNKRAEQGLYDVRDASKTAGDTADKDKKDK